jgi:dTDP-4-dehydrorhamnose reductase
MKRKILVTGCGGLLGSNLLILNEKDDICGLDILESKEPNRVAIDIKKRGDVFPFLKDYNPDIIIHTAAYTNVDLAEDNKEECYSLNVCGTRNLVEGCNKNTLFVYLSTDYIFDGKNGPYSEESAPKPISFYGSTKLEGERVVMNSGLENLIIRTTILYGNHKKLDFVRWVKNNLEYNNRIKIVDDQHGNPTSAQDLSEGIYFLIDKKNSGIFNIVGRDYVSRYEFAKQIAEFYKLDTNLIKKISTNDLNQKAKRPLKAGLKIDKIIKYGFIPHNIKESLSLLKNE